MKSVRLLLISLPLTLVLTGCVSTGSRDLPPVKDSDPRVEDRPVEVPAPVEETPAEEARVVVPPQPSPAVTSLTNQARAQYNSRNYQLAIATAERGLRIDRRAPELYLVLAQSYLQLAMPRQAEQFTQQGLRYAPSGSVVAESLLRVREILSGGQF